MKSLLKVKLVQIFTAVLIGLLCTYAGGSQSTDKTRNTEYSQTSLLILQRDPGKIEFEYIYASHVLQRLMAPCTLWSNTVNITFLHSSSTIRKVLPTKRFLLHSTVHLIYIRSFNYPDVVTYLEKTIVYGAPHRDTFIFYGEKHDELRLKAEHVTTTLKNVLWIQNKNDQDEGKQVEIAIAKREQFEIQPTTHEVLNGKFLKVLAARMPPYLTADSEGTITGGCHHVLLQYIGSKYNFSFTVDTNGTGTGIYRNGSWTGMSGGVYYRKYDIGQIVSANVQRYGVIDITYIQHDAILFVTKIAATKISYGSMLYPFSIPVWLLLINSFAIFTGCLWILLKYGKQSNSMSLAILIPFQISLDQGFNIHIPNRAKLLCITWMIAMVVLTNTYRTDLITYFSFPELERVPKDFQQLDSLKDYTVIFNFVGGTAFQYFNSASGGVAKSIRERFKNERDTKTCILKSVLDQNAVCISWDKLVRPTIATNLTVPGATKASLIISSPIVTYTVGFAFSKHSIYTDAFASILGYVRNSGLVEMLNQEVYYNFSLVGKEWMKSNSTIYQQLKHMRDNEESQFLKLKNVLTIFGVTFAGLLLGSLVALIEMYNK